MYNKYTHCTMYTLLFTAYITAIQYYLFIYVFYSNGVDYKTSTPETSIPIPQVTRQLSIQVTNYQTAQVHMSTFFIPIQDPQVPRTLVEFHCILFSMDPVELPTCAPTGCRAVQQNPAVKTIVLEYLAIYDISYLLYCFQVTSILLRCQPCCQVQLIRFYHSSSLV